MKVQLSGFRSGLRAHPEIHIDFVQRLKIQELSVSRLFVNFKCFYFLWFSRLRVSPALNPELLHNPEDWSDSDNVSALQNTHSRGCC